MASTTETELESKEDVCFDFHSVSDLWGPKAKILTDADCGF